MRLPFRRHRHATPASSPATQRSWGPALDRADLLDLVPRHAGQALAIGWDPDGAAVTWTPGRQDAAPLLIAGGCGSGKTVLCRLLCDQAVLAGMAVLVVQDWGRPYPAHTTLSATDENLADALPRAAVPGRCAAINFRAIAHQLGDASAAVGGVRAALDAFSVTLVGAAAPTLVVLDGDLALEAVGDEMLQTLTGLGAWVVLATQSPDLAPVSLEHVRQTVVLRPADLQRRSETYITTTYAPHLGQIAAAAAPREPGDGVLVHRDPDVAPQALLVPSDGAWSAADADQRPHHGPVIAPDTDRAV